MRVHRGVTRVGDPSRHGDPEPVADERLTGVEQRGIDRTGAKRRPQVAQRFGQVGSPLQDVLQARWLLGHDRLTGP